VFLFFDGKLTDDVHVLIIFLIVASEQLTTVVSFTVLDFIEQIEILNLFCSIIKMVIIFCFYCKFGVISVSLSCLALGWGFSGQLCEEGLGLFVWLLVAGMGSMGAVLGFLVRKIGEFGYRWGAA
jgi:hypothetical protein